MTKTTKCRQMIYIFKYKMENDNNVRRDGQKLKSLVMKYIKLPNKKYLILPIQNNGNTYRTMLVDNTSCCFTTILNSN